jgi:hypothetical protein
VIPGVEAVGATSNFPLRRRSNSVSVIAEGQDPDAADDNPHPQLARITPDYFSALGIPVLRGDASSFSYSQETGASVDAVVSEGLEQALWPKSRCDWTPTRSEGSRLRS